MTEQEERLEAEVKELLESYDDYGKRFEPVPNLRAKAEIRVKAETLEALFARLHDLEEQVEEAEGERDEANRVLSEVHKVIDGGDEYGTRSMYGAFLKALKILEAHRKATQEAEHPDELLGAAREHADG